MTVTTQQRLMTRVTATTPMGYNANANGGYETQFWNDVRGTVFEKDLNNGYENIVHWE